MGVGLKVAQEILRHTSIITTAVYVHPDLEQMRVALDALPRIRGKSKKLELSAGLE